MVESTMRLHIKVAELNPLSDGKGIIGISSAVFFNPLDPGSLY